LFLRNGNVDGVNFWCGIDELRNKSYQNTLVGHTKWLQPY